MKVVQASLAIVSIVLAGDRSVFAQAASCNRGSPLDFCPSQNVSVVEFEMQKEMLRHPMEKACADAIAAREGGSKTFGFDSYQGIYLEGLGLEGRHFSLGSGSQGPLWPPSPAVGYRPGTILVDASKCDNPVMQIKIDECNPPASGHMSCQVEVLVKDGVVQGHPICGQPIGTKTGVQIVKGFWDEKGKWQFDAAKPTVTLSCDTRVVEQLNQPTRADGSVTRCIEYFGYGPTNDNKNLTACIRMQRADYCGDGQSHTYIGSYVVAYDKNNPIETQECGDGQCFEASWSEVGAVCVGHTRWTGPGLDFEGTWCKTNFNQVHGKPYRCRAGGVVDAKSFFTRSKTNTCGGTGCTTNTGVCSQVCSDNASPGCQSPAVNTPIEKKK